MMVELNTETMKTLKGKQLYKALKNEILEIIDTKSIDKGIRYPFLHNIQLRAAGYPLGYTLEGARRIKNLEENEY